MVSLNEETAEGRYRYEVADHATPDKLFDQSWAMTVLEQAQEQLRREYRASARGEIFEHLKIFSLAITRRSLMPKLELSWA